MELYIDELHFFWRLFSLGSKLVCRFCECLSEEWSVATQKEEQRFCTSSKDTNIVKLK